MDPKTSYRLEIRIVATNSRCRWFSISTVVDADTKNFKDLVEDIVDKYPCGYGDIVDMFYYCGETKSNIKVSSDHDLVAMFSKNASAKTCLLTFAYHPMGTDTPVIPLWHDLAEMPNSSMQACNLAEPTPAPTQTQASTQTLASSQTATTTDDGNYLNNPKP